MMKRVTYALIFLLLSTGHASSQSGNHGDGHAEHHDVYRAWVRPGTGMSCCNNEDCRPTRAYMEEDGLWRAWDGERWLIIPPHALLPADSAKDGRSHLCSSSVGTVFCFSPAQPKG